jgi:hypothetical protein
LPPYLVAQRRRYIRIGFLERSAHPSQFGRFVAHFITLQAVRCKIALLFRVSIENFSMILAKGSFLCKLGRWKSPSVTPQLPK